MDGSAHETRKLPQHTHSPQTFFEQVIDKAYHSFAIGTSIGLCGFGNDEPPAILSRLKLMYGHRSDSKTECHLLHLHEPMDLTLHIEVIPN
jgi:hypothetical protein